ncbi:MAG: anaerobic ribonucleoside-triphosphate reductase activating protein [Puniceicoccales bacterium]|jgi:pyruvate formate lyase activating enzyme|nr:anaerobic ribonucleoside-triphosphate reductase activating protein [Puniceicoccales bacterium]
MLIGGLQKISLIDFPGKIASVIFTQGCNFRCPFCHNGHLVDPAKFEATLSEDEVLNYLSSRKGRVEGVVISGGEPTLQRDLKAFMQKIKELGFCSKLDTNGTKPDIVADLTRSNLVDFIAMDIKHNLPKYDAACGVKTLVKNIIQSINFVKTCGVDYEFRTTIVPGIHRGSDIVSIAKSIRGAKKFVIQEFVPDHAMDNNLRHEQHEIEESLFCFTHRAELENIRAECLHYVTDFEIRFAR